MGVFAAEQEPAEEHHAEEKPFNAKEVILHHVLDDHIWHLWDGHYGTIYLPVIVYSSEKGLDVFSSHNFSIRVKILYNTANRPLIKC